MATKFAPMSIIGSVMSLAAFGGLILGVNSYFLTKAEADEVIGRVQQQQQVDRTETDLKLIELELEFLKDKTDAESERREDYLKQRQRILEEYQLKLQTEK